MSAVAQHYRPTSERVNTIIGLIIAAPIVLLVLSLFVLASNDQFAGMDMSFKVAVFVTLAGMALLLILVSLLAWTIRRKNWGAAIFMASCVLICAVAFLPLRSLLIDFLSFVS